MRPGDYLQDGKVVRLMNYVSQRLIAEQPSDVPTSVVRLLEAYQPLEVFPNESNPDLTPQVRVYARHQLLPHMIESWIDHLLETQPLNVVEASIQYFKRLKVKQYDASGVAMEVEQRDVAVPPSLLSPPSISLRPPTATSRQSSVSTWEDDPPESERRTANETSRGAEMGVEVSSIPRSLALPRILPVRESAKPLVLVAYFSVYGHSQSLAESIGSELLSEDMQVSMKSIQDVLTDSERQALHPSASTVNPQLTVADIIECNGLVLCFPAKFGLPAAPVLAMLEEVERCSLMKGVFPLLGKPCGLALSTGTQHGGQEAAAVLAHALLLRCGALCVGVPCPAGKVDEVAGGSLFGPSTIAGDRGERTLSALELEDCRVLGRQMAIVCRQLQRPV